MKYFKIRHHTTQKFLNDIQNIIHDYNPSLEKYLSDEGESYNEEPTYSFMPQHGLNPTAFEVVEFENDVEINTKKFS